MSDTIKTITISQQASIKDAMKCIDKGGRRIAVVVDKRGRLVNVVTDGDVRRAILAGKKLDDSIKGITKKKPVVGRDGMPDKTLLGIMEQHKIVTLPIVDRKGFLKNIVLMQDIVKISLSSPDITEKEIDAVKAVLTSPVLSIGPNVEKFEKLFAKYIGVKYAVAVNSGTSALHLSVRALDIKDGDEIITSPFSFIASANCALFERAKPVFVDVDPHTLCIDPESIEKKITKNTKAILPVHIFGHPCQMDKIMAIARKHHLYVIEDACEALGAEFKGKKVGSFGNVATFAFYPNKQITTSEGGMLVTNDRKIAELCRAMRNQGRTNPGQWLSHEILGFNYRLGELSSALGVVQMQRVKEILKKRATVAKLYSKRLKTIPWLDIPYVAPDVTMSWFVYVIHLKGQYFSKQDRDAIMKEMQKNDVPCRDYFPPIHLEPFYVKTFGYKPGDYPITEAVSSTTIALPFYNHLTQQQINRICSVLESAIKKVKS